MNKLNKISRWRSLFILFLSILVFGSVVLRAPKTGNENYKDSDATYHVLLTMKAYDETPISVHKFLPIVSLGDEMDKNISWGATIPDTRGNYYYTSFSPAGYIAPYLFIKIFGLEINELSLYIFNSIICLICCMLIIFLFKKVFKNRLSTFTITIFNILIYLFQFEIMHSQGIVYWHQSLIQMLILLQLILFLYKENKIARVGFFILCLINPYVEWTGYVTNIGFAIAMLFNKNIVITKKNIEISTQAFLSILLVAITTLFSFFLFSFHYLLVVSSKQYWNALINRFMARDITKASLDTLLIGYWQSYKYLLIILGLLLCIVLSVKEMRKKLIANIKQDRVIWFLLLFPLIENIIMMQHAIQYSFDRLKGIFILILLFFTLFLILEDTFKYKFKGTMLVLIISMAFVSLFQYINYDTVYKWKANYLNENKLLSDYISSRFDNYNSILTQQISVRGYDNILFDRGIYEKFNVEKSVSLALKNDKQFAVELLVEAKPWNMDRYIGCKIYDLKENNVEIVKINDKKLEKSLIQSVIVSGKTDDNWKNGVSNVNSILLIPNNKFNRESIKDSIALKSNYIVKNIKNIEVSDLWINVELENREEIQNFESQNIIEVIK